MKSKTIGQYRITDRKIGEGAFGTVFIGIDLGDSNKEVAVKVVEHSRLEGDALDYFYEEILAMKSCLSEHIVKLYDIKKTENHFYVFLEYCDEGDLQKYIKKKGRLPEEEALRLFWEIVRGFRSIVKSKRIHRDLKPANIFLKNGQIKIGDFGLAKILSERDMTSTFAGSPYNMAPEVLARKHYDNRADIYGIGTVLYYMIFGCPPFKASTVPELIYEINFKRYKKFDKDLISDYTYNLLIRMLKPDPASRISWYYLFTIESKIRDSGSIKMYKKYYELAKKADVNNINAIPGVFCLLNLNHYYSRKSVATYGELEKHPPFAELELMDINLCTKLFLSLVQVTEISESCVDF